MTSNISTLNIRKNLGDILNRVALRHDQFVIQRKGKALAALVPVEKLEALQQAARMHLAEILTRPVKPLSQNQADRLADEAKHQSRPKRSSRK